MNNKQLTEKQQNIKNLMNSIVEEVSEELEETDEDEDYYLFDKKNLTVTVNFSAALKKEKN